MVPDLKDLFLNYKLQKLSILSTINFTVGKDFSYVQKHKLILCRFMINIVLQLFKPKIYLTIYEKYFYNSLLQYFKDYTFK
jgi:hypothetical protein